MVCIETSKGLRLSRTEQVYIDRAGQNLLRRKIGGTGKAPIEVNIADLHAVKSEIGKIGIKRRFGLIMQKTGADMRARVRPGGAAYGEARMGERVAFAAAGQQKRTLRVVHQVLRMDSQRREQKIGLPS